MYFTREPIIETIISPREGYKLILRSSKLDRQEEYSVDSVEVISFGNHCFYRSLDRNETFLLPVFDYEVIEARSARLTLKTTGAPQEKEIKIGKPREAKPLTQEERKREKRMKKHKERNKAEAMLEEEEPIEAEASPEIPEPTEKVKPVERESLTRILIPPPSSLISDTLSRYQIPPVVEEAPAVQEEPSANYLLEEQEDERLTE